MKTVLLKDICDFEKGTTGLAKAVPSEYLFVKSQDGIENLKSQTVTSSLEHVGRRILPFVFSEQGVVMLPAVLRSDTAVRVSILIMDTSAVEMSHKLNEYDND